MQTINFKHLRLRDGDLLLDVGCGEGRHSIAAYMEADVRVIGVDIDSRDLQTARVRFGEFDEPHNLNKSLDFQQADASNLPFSDNSFDKVVCSEVLEHIADYSGVLAEIERVLKPDGVVAVSVPRAWPEKICWKLSKSYHRVPGGHIRIFNATQLQNDIEDIGMRRFARHWAHALHVPYWWLKCWQWGNDEHSLVKAYHRFLVWDLLKRPLLTRVLDWLLNPIIGKSIVMYFERAE